MFFQARGLMCVAGVLCWCGSARAVVVADYQDDFRTDGTPAPGWAYLWNATNVIGVSADYAPLVHDTNHGGDYETQANGVQPDAPPGAFLAATKTFLHPGQGEGQAGNAIERYVIAAYTISAEDIARAGGGIALITGGFFALGDSDDGVHASVYVNDTLVSGPTLLPPDVVYPDLTLPLGTLSAGDTVYVCIGSRGNDLNDALTIDYSIELLPETAPKLVAAYSQRLHPGVGPLPIPLPLSGTPRIEPRMNGAAGSAVILQFSRAVEAVDGSIDCGDEIIVTNGVCHAVVAGDNNLVVSMTFNANSCVKVAAGGLRGAGGGEALTGDSDVEVVSQPGNVNGAGGVNILDLQAIKNALAQPVGLTNFWLDVNVSGGLINILDLQATKNNLNQPASCP